jgi:integrase
MEGSWRNEKHKYQWRQTLTVYCAAIRERPVASIDTHDVLELLKPIWLTKSETASRLRGRIELVLDFAKAKGWREGENPARWRGHLKNVLPPRKRLLQGHLAALPYEEVPAFVEELRKRDALAARALEFTILTAARTGEALGAKWEEIDLEKKIWTVPALRMKGKEEHVVPLSTAALAVLKPLYELQQSDYVFPGNVLRRRKRPAKQAPSHLSTMSMEMLLRRMGIEKATVHGFRSSFRDWCGDETPYPREVAEAALAHKVGNAVEQAYRRSKALEKRRALMEDWVTFCIGNHSDEVVRIIQGRAS